MINMNWLYEKRFLILAFSSFLIQLSITYYVMTPITQWHLFGFQIILIFLLASTRFYSILFTK
jgi:hypothetical protein